MNIKTILLLLAFCWAGNMNAQEGLFDNIELKGGYLFDNDDFYDDLSAVIRETATNNSYHGFEYVALAFTRKRDHKRIGVEFDFFRFEKNPPANGITFDWGFQQFPDFKRSKLQGQVSYFHGHSLLQNEKFDFYLGPIASLAFRKENYVPKNSQGFPLQTIDAVLGLGGKFQAEYSISNKLGIVIATKFILIDLINRYERVSNPNLTLRQQRSNSSVVDLLRSDVVLQLGLSYRL